MERNVCMNCKMNGEQCSGEWREIVRLMERNEFAGTGYSI
jgi:hypothetical protein